MQSPDQAHQDENHTTDESHRSHVRIVDPRPPIRDAEVLKRDLRRRWDAIEYEERYASTTVDSLTFATDAGVHIGDFALAAEVVEWIEILAILTIVVGVSTAVVFGITTWTRSGPLAAVNRFKQVIARGLLIGLDLLIAADVIKTVTLEGTLESAAVLGLLVVIRTFLSWALVLEVEGDWPWNLKRTDGPSAKRTPPPAE